MLESSARRLFVVLALVLLLGCSGETATAPEPEPTPIARLNTASMQVPRIEFCSLVPDDAVTDALGAKPDADSAYGNGDEVELPRLGGGTATTDVVHELGCSWTTEEGSAARAWVFARPVEAAFARQVVAAGQKARGCRAVAGPAFGTPSVTQVCAPQQGGADGVSRVRHAGLFGQTWLTCEVTGTDEVDRLRGRADAWCVEVLNALDTGR